MKNTMLDIINNYLKIFPEEQNRQKTLIDYLHSHNDDEIIDWNNFQGHIVASGFIYTKEDNQFLVLYHKDLKMYLYPGGHMNQDDINPLEAAKREVQEETGLTNIQQFLLATNTLIPLDIDTHIIGYNERLDLPAHYHFDFRYLFLIDKKTDINIDQEELSNYKWIDINELYHDPNYGNVATKIQNFLQ